MYRSNPVIIASVLCLRNEFIWHDIIFTPCGKGGLNQSLPRSDFQAQNIGEGAKIILSGYFVQLEGSTKLQPLVREGVLSMIPDMPLTTTLKKPGMIYLGEVHIFGGNSGSPVFISTYGIRPEGPELDDI